MQNKILVTGGSGFLALHIINQLLKQNFTVKTTVRSQKSFDNVLATLKANHTPNLDQLSYVKADLSNDDNWDKAMQDCEYVLSVASPVFFEIPKNEDQAIRPAVDGIRRILMAAEKANVKKVVMTSNFGAVGFSKPAGPGQITTEDDWTNVNEPGLSIYEKSKLIAEKTAWEYVDQHPNGPVLTTINPVAMFGPSLNNHVSGSLDLLINLLNGSMKRMPNLPLNLVDVRDVVELHIKAMLTPNADGQRFIATADGQISMPQIANILKKQRPQISQKVSIKLLPNWLINLMAPFSKQAKEGKLMINMNRNVSNEKAKRILDWQPRDNNEKLVLISTDNLVKNKII